YASRFYLLTCSAISVSISWSGFSHGAYCPDSVQQTFQVPVPSVMLSYGIRYVSSPLVGVWRGTGIFLGSQLGNENHLLLCVSVLAFLFHIMHLSHLAYLAWRWCAVPSH